MSFHHLILTAIYYALCALNAVGRSFRLTPVDQSNFVANQRWLKRSCNFVSVKQFESMVSCDEPIYGCNLRLTFDDGFTSSSTVCEEPLNPMGICAVFFAVFELVGKANLLEVRPLIANRIYLGARAADLSLDSVNMSSTDIGVLLDEGHPNGCHTATYARLPGSDSHDCLEREIISSAGKLERHNSAPAERFSYTFGNLVNFSEDALALALRRFRLIYSELRGNNVRGVSLFALRRDSAEFQDASSNDTVFFNRLLGAFSEGVAGTHYAPSLARLDARNLRA